MGIKRVLALFLSLVLLTYGSFSLIPHAIAASSDDIQAQIDELERQEQTLRE